MRDIPGRLDAQETAVRELTSAVQEVAAAVRAQEKLIQAIALMVGVPKTDTQRGMLQATADDGADAMAARIHALNSNLEGAA